MADLASGRVPSRTASREPPVKNSEAIFPSPKGGGGGNDDTIPKPAETSAYVTRHCEPFMRERPAEALQQPRDSCSQKKRYDRWPYSQCNKSLLFLPYCDRLPLGPFAACNPIPNAIGPLVAR
jgi:hypothetical protein